MRGIAVFLLVFLFIPGQAQESSDDKALEMGFKASCDCIDEIKLHNRLKKDVIDEISGCIDTGVITLQLTEQMLGLTAPGGEVEDAVRSGEGDVTIALNSNSDSQEYKDTYFTLERILMDNCEALEVAIYSDETRSEKSVSDNPEAREYYNLGQEEFMNENYEEAIVYFEKALAVDPNFAFAWDNIGISYRRLDNYDKAIEAYNKSLELDPYGPVPLQNLAVTHTYKKDYDKAIEAYHNLGKAFPGNPEVYYGVARVNLEKEDFETALDYACKAYLIYIEHKSPYRVDAEQMISILYDKMAEQNKEDKFMEILERNNIHVED